MDAAKPKQDVRSFVQSSNPNSTFVLDGERGTGRSKLCSKDPRTNQLDCIDIALEARNLFETMQSLNFFCSLPQDPTKTYINCEKIPQ
ncbi:hypothetical protein IE53DRAFT_384329 [Violaceomyces palustris]|uniref:Uncharacterized protein n=1 Tax=Violaceomyces palustris TaxID=1673888 RepID=A0ACD0P540_9BASI|nr:hypothetical protein IE53DRAFT_384329 [Violaceomyces palustris]